MFISYSKIDRGIVEQLAGDLLAKGFTVWWDTELVSGESFREVIVRQLKEARAVIVVWTPSSVKSEWVISEADRGRYRGILIPVRIEDLPVHDIPPPFDVRHMDLVTNRAAIYAALAKLGVSPALDSPKPATPAAAVAALTEASIAEALALEHWQAIKTTSDPARLRAFLAEFGAAKLSRLARERLEELEASAWRRLPRRRGIEALRGFLAEFPDGKLASAAEAEVRALEHAAAEKAFEALLRTDDIAAVDRFLAAHPDGKLAAKAMARRDMLVSYKEALASADVDTLKSFLARYPGGRPALRVSEALRTLERTGRRPPRAIGKLFGFAAAGLILVGLVGAIVWIWRDIGGSLLQPTPLESASSSTTQPQPAPPAPQRPSKIVDRLTPDTASPKASPNAQAASVVAQRVVLDEEDAQDPGGKRFVGSVVWRTETVSRGANQPSDVIVRADIEIPDRKMKLKWTLQRNFDKTLPASHTVEIVFTLPPDFVGGGIQNVPGVLMKDAEQMRGLPLAGLAVKVTNGYFLIGLSAVEGEMKKNIELLKTRSWFDVPIVYTDGRRAILAIEKGNPGERGFNDAFAAWKQ